MAKRKPKWTKYQISMTRRGVMRFDAAYNAPDAARKATKQAKDGWTVEVQGGTKRLVTHMTCKPALKRGKAYAVCTMRPTFRQAIQRR